MRTQSPFSSRILTDSPAGNVRSGVRLLSGSRKTGADSSITPVSVRTCGGNAEGAGDGG